jgi:hypothetical protein
MFFVGKTRSCAGTPAKQLWCFLWKRISIRPLRDRRGSDSAVCRLPSILPMAQFSFEKWRKKHSLYRYRVFFFDENPASAIP